MTFKIGDKVRVISCDDAPDLNGFTGRIEYIHDWGEYPIQVWRGREEHYNFTSEQLELVK